MTNPSSDARRPFGAQAVPQTGTALHSRWASDVIAHSTVEVVASDTTVLGTTSSVTGSLTTARIGDAVWFTSGTLAKTLFSIVGVSGSTLSLGQTAASAPTAGDTYDIYRYRPATVSSSGGTTVDTELPAAAALADGESNATPVPEVGARMMGFNGTTWDRARLADVLTSAPAGTEKGVVTRNIPSGTQNTIELSGLMPKVYDYVSLGYTGSDLTTAVYKTGGAAGTTVATLTMTYSASILQTVTRT